MTSIAVIVNPRSRANRRDPRIAAEFQALIGDRGRVLAPKSLAELDTIAADLHRTPPAVIGVHGGDGTLHKTVTALGRVFGDEPLPPIAILCGGTMNVVATSLHIRERPRTFLAAITDGAARRQAAGYLAPPLPAHRRHAGLPVRQRAAGQLPGRILRRPGRAYGPGRAMWLLTRAFFSALWRGPFARRLFRRFKGSVHVDGQPLEQGAFVGLMAGTVREVGMGFKLVHRADDDPERFGVLAIHAPPLALALDLWAVHRGRGIAAQRAFSAVASSMDVHPNDGSMSYTIDGDLYRTQAPLSISARTADRVRQATLCVDCPRPGRYHGRHAMSSSFPLDGMRVRFAGDSNVGMKRAHNEDSFYLPESERLAIVADGMGGHASGEVASRMAVDTIVGFFKATRTTSS